MYMKRIGLSIGYRLFLVASFLVCAQSFVCPPSEHFSPCKCKDSPHKVIDCSNIDYPEFDLKETFRRITGIIHENYTNFHQFYMSNTTFVHELKDDVFGEIA